METLLRPAKQLAEWDSCFAQDLEKYFNILKETQSVNFGEAALVLQNSANVYARRVEYLWDETEALNKTLSSHSEDKSAEEVTAGISSKNKIKKTKGVIDFNDFETLEFHQQIGKSNNLKEGGQKRFKLLTRRFTQLESNLAQLSNPIEILSTDGEVIGNKYDFRCNQQLTNNCMLVDELTPNDFSTTHTAADGNADSINDNGAPTTIPIQIPIQDTRFDSMFEQNQSADSPESIVFEEMETEVNNPCSNENENGSVIESNNIPDETDAGYTSGDAAEDSIQPNLTGNATTDGISEAAQAQETTIMAESNTAEAGVTTTEAVENVTEKESTPINENIENEVLEPIPFEQGVPDRIPRRRAAFKLPCHISLLKSTRETRKRKNISESKKREYLTRFLLDKYDHLSHKKLKTYSPTRQLFSPLKQEELEEFQRSFDQYLKSMRGSENYHYDAITRGVRMDLLGFQPNFTKNYDDPLRGNDACSAEDSTRTECSSIIEQDTDLLSVPESFTTPPPTPEAADHHTLNYRELVEQRMKQIGEESREQTDLEQRVSEWHRSLKPKLIAAGRRPPFHIHEYGSRIIETLESAERNKIPFDNLVRNQSAPEVARYFLASLQLANSYNVAINTTSTGDSGFGIELKLLEKERQQHDTLSLHETLDRIPASLSKVSKNRTSRMRISTTT